jgi:hypothetical protein
MATFARKSLPDDAIEEISAINLTRNPFRMKRSGKEWRMLVGHTRFGLQPTPAHAAGLL